MALTIPDEYPDLLADICRQIYGDLVKAGIKPVAAAKISWQAVEHARVQIGGISEYIPKGQAYELSIRDREIWSKFKGDNFEELCREYELTEMRIRQIVAKVKEIEQRKRQRDLFQPAKMAAAGTSED